VRWAPPPVKRTSFRTHGTAATAPSLSRCRSSPTRRKIANVQASVRRDALNKAANSQSRGAEYRLSARARKRDSGQFADETLGEGELDGTAGRAGFSGLHLIGGAFCRQRVARNRRSSRAVVAIRTVRRRREPGVGRPAKGANEGTTGHGGENDRDRSPGRIRPARTESARERAWPTSPGAGAIPRSHQAARFMAAEPGRVHVDPRRAARSCCPRTKVAQATSGWNRRTWGSPFSSDSARTPGEEVARPVRCRWLRGRNWGHPRVIEETNEINLSVGGSWNEQDAGTNGIGTALAEGQRSRSSARSTTLRPGSDGFARGADPPSDHRRRSP
jgi:hypothetical protein